VGRRSRVLMGVALGLASVAATCDRIYLFKREAPLSVWPDPACVETQLRAGPRLGEVKVTRPHPSSDDRRFTLHTFRVAGPDVQVSLCFQTDAAQQDMDISLHWSRLHHRPSDAEMKKITGLMDLVEDRILECRGVPGGFIGALELWFFEFSLNRLLAAASAGAAFAVVFVCLMRVSPVKNPSRSLGVLYSVPSGLVGGAAYWLVAVPETSIRVSSVIGVALGALMVLGEW
jgi:hypothetical protein